MAVIPQEQQKNFEIFRDCLSAVLIEKISHPKSQPKRRTKANTNNKAAQRASQPHFDDDTSFNPAEDLAEFTDYIASEAFQYLPEELKTLDYYGYSKDADLQARYALPLTGDNVADLLPTLDPSISDSLTAYGITHEAVQGINEFLAPVLTSLVNAISTPPPAPSSTKAQAEGCEICGRDWVPLSYHHLIPRFVHAKAVKRGWHREEDLQNVAWLCGACHRFVHRFADHEELARRYYTVELLMQEEQVVKWADWVGRLRWKGR
ncbi:hypothetical protein DL768_002191 [Monosporascus sp. mg162]|nr:hypothetical protein DL768_002191 [Monosporascus sp. mg162]